LNTEKGLIQHGDKLDNASTQSLKNSLETLAETNKLGVKTAQKLEQDTERIAGLLDGLDRIDGDLDRSKTIVRRLARRVYTDKAVWVLIFLITAAVIFIIAWRKYH